MNSPWFGLSLVFLAFVLVFIIYNNISKNYSGICPECGKEFKASVPRLIFTIHVFYKFLVKCPACGYRGLIEFKKDK